MDIFSVIDKRFSVRNYKPVRVPRELLLKIVEAAHQAPSSRNLQPWEFVIVDDPELKAKLAVTGNNSTHVAQAGAAIVCLGSVRQQDALADRIAASIPADATPERVERTMRSVNALRTNTEFRRQHVVENTYIGISWLVLAAEALGLSTIWMGGFDGPKIKEQLNIPDDYYVVSVVSVGYPADDLVQPPRKRRPLSEIYSFNGFGQK